MYQASDPKEIFSKECEENANTSITNSSRTSITSYSDRFFTKTSENESYGSGSDC